MKFRSSMGRAVVAAILLVAGAVRAEPLTLDAALARALADNPALEAIEARARALAEVPEQVGTLPDPVASVNLLNLPLDSFSFTQEPMTQLQFGLSQTLPFPGTLALRGEVAERRAAGAGFELEERRLQLARDVEAVWWNLFYLDRVLDVIARNETLLRQFVEVAETRYIVGRGLQQDILLAQLELSRLDDRRLQLLSLRDSQVASLNALLNRPAGTEVELPATVEQALPELPPAPELVERALENRPLLAVEREALAAAEAQVELARKSYFPEFRLGVAYGLRGGSNIDGSDRADLASIRFSMSLPLYAASRQERAVDQRNAERMASRHRYHDRRNAVAAEVSRALSDYRRAVEQVVLFRDTIIPQARQTVDAMMAGYQVGKVDFLNLVRSQTTLLDYESDYWRVFSRARQALARLEAAVGGELPSVATREQASGEDS